jgi:hypothetical protein
MNHLKLAAIFLVASCLLVALARSAQSQGPGAHSYVLIVPPEFLGQRPTTSSPSPQWLYMDKFATQQECEAFKATAKLRIALTDGDGHHTVKSLAYPSNSACMTFAEFFESEGPRR